MERTKEVQEEIDRAEMAVIWAQVAQDKVAWLAAKRYQQRVVEGVRLLEGARLLWSQSL